MPEEINRIVAYSNADYLWTHSPNADANRIRKGIVSKKISKMKNITIDSLSMIMPAIRKKSAKEDLGIMNKTYGMDTLQ
ncbi:MAG: hypothetical protein ACQ9MH_21265 [Nitrospinales bacterium]